MREENKRYSWEPQIDCYRVEKGDELTECHGKECNCCGRFNPVENSHTIDCDKDRVKRARAKYHQDRYNSLRKSLTHVREKEEGLGRSRRTLENRLEQQASELLNILFPKF
jgi:hypothetical protein